LIALWGSGYVEPASPPPRPLHILAQQLLALALQERGIGRTEWFDRVRAVPAFLAMGPSTAETLVEWMLEQEILWDEAGILWLGREGQDVYGRKNFLGLISVFTAPPLFTVKHAGRELGFVDESTFLVRRDDGPPVLLLAGRAWRVLLLDWKRRLAQVEPAEDEGRLRWRGQGQFLSRALCRAIRGVLASNQVSQRWSRRARSRLDETRADFPWLHDDGGTVLALAGGKVSWWTFAGGRANAALAAELGGRLGARVAADNFAVRFEAGAGLAEVSGLIDGLRELDPSQIVPAVSEDAVEGLKFSECLPGDLAVETVRGRLLDAEGVAEVIRGAVRVVSEG
jgi:ATP-dependent Lhr-like helicase